MAETIESLVENYRKRRITRREFIHRAIVFTGSLAAATSFANALFAPDAKGAQVDPNDPGLVTREVSFNSSDGTEISGYLTRPTGDVRRPAVIVIHENRGINDHIRDVSRRLAKEGYVALAPDLLSRFGGTRSFSDSNAANEGIRKLSDDDITRDLTGAINFLKEQNYVRANKIGVTGFCWGGGRALLIATRNKDVASAVIYYGSNPRNLDDVKNISAAVYGHYGEDDPRLTAEVPKLAEAMKKYGKTFDYKVYPDAPHGFNNDTSSRNYRERAAKEAWAKTLEFFKKHLQD
jgi:carboxymethylenebutenolidase